MEDTSKYYYVTIEIMKRWNLFDAVLFLAGYVFCYIKTSIFLSIFYCFYVGFIGLSKKCWRQDILEEWLRNAYLVL